MVDTTQKQKSKEKIKGKGRHPNSLKQLEKGKFEKGKSGNPEGKKVGTRNYKTIEREAIKLIAKENNLTEEEFENMLVAKGLKRAFAGDYRYYKDAMDRRHGQSVKTVDVTSGGQTMGEILDALEAEDE